MHAAQTEPHLSEAEVRKAIASLTPGDKTALMKIARVYARKTSYAYEDLMQEAFMRVLSGRRAWPREIPAISFWGGVLRSIAWEWKAEQPDEEAAAGDVGAQERGAIAAIDAGKIIQLFEDDPAARQIIIGMMDGCRGEELQALSGLSKTEYESKRTKIRRRLEKLDF